MFSTTTLAQFDPALAQAISQEDARQEAHIIDCFWKLLFTFSDGGTRL